MVKGLVKIPDSSFLCSTEMSHEISGGGDVYSQKGLQVVLGHSGSSYLEFTPQARERDVSVT